MNVAFGEWIPVVNTAGRRELASLHDVLVEGDKYADLAVRPHERVALMRLFLCVAHAALDGPKDYDEWCEVPKRLPDAARCYLSKWKDCFHLFDTDKPWLQIKELTGDARSPVALLDFEIATGNNSTLFDHEGQVESRKLADHRIPLILLTFLNFSSGGGSPIAQWQSVRTSQVGNPDAPCLSQSMAHCLLRGNTLVETIHLNMPSLDTVMRTYKGIIERKKEKTTKSWNRVEVLELAVGCPVWEQYPLTPDPNSREAVNATRTYVGRLVPISRWIKLLSAKEMYCCNGFKYDTFKDGFAAEPTAAVRLIAKKDKAGLETVERGLTKVDPAKSLWRELSALLVSRSAYGIGGPLAMSNAPSDAAFDFQVCAMTRDQASMDITVESVFHISHKLQHNVAVYQAEVAGSQTSLGAEGYARRLRWAIQEYRSAIDSDWIPRVNRTEPKKQNALRVKLAQVALLAYWTSVEKNLPLLWRHIEAVGSEDAMPTRDAWRKMLAHCARDAYCRACGRETPRQIRAFAKGWDKLIGKKQETEDSADTKEDAA